MSNSPYDFNYDNPEAFRCGIVTLTRDVTCQECGYRIRATGNVRWAVDYTSLGMIHPSCAIKLGLIKVKGT